MIMAFLTTAIGACGHLRAKRNGGYLRIAFRTSIASSVVILFAVVMDYLTYRNVINNIEKSGNNFSAGYSNGFYVMIASVVFMVIAIMTFYIGHRLNAGLRQQKLDLLHNKEMSGEAYEQRIREEEYKAKIARVHKPMDEYAEYEEVVEERARPSTAKQGYPSSKRPSPPTKPESYPLVPIQNTPPIQSNGYGYPQQSTRNNLTLPNNMPYPPHSRTPSPVRQPSPASNYFPPSPSSTTPLFSPSGLYPPAANQYPPSSSPVPLQHGYPPSAGYPSPRDIREQQYPQYHQQQNQGYFQDYSGGRNERAAWH
jgi:hypothetical protein